MTTPIGHWQILVKLPQQTMRGTIDGQPYEVDDVPDVMYFDDLGDALHYTYSHNNFGTPMSHGCINLPLDVAADEMMRPLLVPRLRLFREPCLSRSVGEPPRSSEPAPNPSCALAAEP